MNVAKGAGCFLLLCCVVTDHKEKVDRTWGRVDDILEPCFVDHGGGRDDLGDISVAGEVKDNTKGKNTDAVLSGKVSVLVSQVGVLIGGGVQNLDIRGQVPVAPDFGEVVVVLVSDVGVVELVVANR